MLSHEIQSVKKYSKDWQRFLKAHNFNKNLKSINRHCLLNV